MIDYFLMYSFNIINVVMVYYTYQATHVEEQFAPNEDDKAMERVKKLGPTGGSANEKNKLWNSFFIEGGEAVDKLEEARRLNKQGQIIFVIAFLIFQIIFWSVGLSEYFSENKIEKLTELEELREKISDQGEHYTKTYYVNM